LRDGGLCLFSPVAGLSIEAKRSLDAIGQVTHLFAPNHYHNLGLAEYASSFPQASLCAPTQAIPRLEKVTGLAFHDLAALSAKLPAHITLAAPEGLKTGETWLRSKTDDLSAWFVVDALAGPKMADGRHRFDRPEMLKTFPHFGTRDAKSYTAWFERQLRADQPRLVVPCHGGIIAAHDLPRKLRQLQSETFAGR
jgi:hypothetical protein